MPSKKSGKVKKVPAENKKTFSWPIIIGAILILVSLSIPLKTFAPVITSEIKYQISPPKKNIDIAPVNTDFSIVIPKIGANTKVVKNIDPFDSQIYQQALTQGVAHASTSDTPDKSGNVFIFAHSAGNWYQANQYNGVFYLLNKLTSGDEIFVYYQNQKYTYSVDQIKTINSQETSYLNSNFGQHQLTLMTCWPPGTTLKRLLVTATLKK
jgi:sortase A